MRKAQAIQAQALQYLRCREIQHRILWIRSCNRGPVLKVHCSQAETTMHAWEGLEECLQLGLTEEVQI